LQLQCGCGRLRSAFDRLRRVVLEVGTYACGPIEAYQPTRFGQHAALLFLIAVKGDVLRGRHIHRLAVSSRQDDGIDDDLPFHLLAFEALISDLDRFHNCFFPFESRADAGLRVRPIGTSRACS
jgi:hypothetical protein